MNKKIIIGTVALPILIVIILIAVIYFTMAAIYLLFRTGQWNNPFEAIKDALNMGKDSVK